VTPDEIHDAVAVRVCGWTLVDDGGEYDWKWWADADGNRSYPGEWEPTRSFDQAMEAYRLSGLVGLALAHVAEHEWKAAAGGETRSGRTPAEAVCAVLLAAKGD